LSGFEVVGSETVATIGFLTVDRLEIQGVDGERYERSVVRHPGAVVVVPVEPGGTHAILVRQYRAAIGGDLFEVPAGKRDVDGEPPETTAVRELDEEIGMRPGRLVKLAEFYNTPGFCDEYTHLFVALDVEATDGPRAVGPEEAAMTVERVALADVDALIAAHELVDAKSIIGLTLTRRFLSGEFPGVA
jgi:8-oxo-dGTP pyrophosphatase MutT (NUDIX family)